MIASDSIMSNAANRGEGSDVLVIQKANEMDVDLRRSALREPGTAKVPAAVC